MKGLRSILFGVILFCVLWGLMGCNVVAVQPLPVSTEVPTVTATATAAPTSTIEPTPIPTATATLEPTATELPTKELRHGIDTPVFTLGIDLRFVSIANPTEIYITGIDNPVNPGTGFVIWALTTESLNGEEVLTNWKELGNEETFVVLSNGEVSQGVIVEKKEWYTALPIGVTSVSIRLPGVEEVDITSLFP